MIATADVAAIADAVDLVIFATPSRHLRATVEGWRRTCRPRRTCCPWSRASSPDTLLRMSQVIADAAHVPSQRIAALSGPNLALEIARGLPASAVVAAEDPALADRIVARLARREFRLYVNRDILGVELCGALKNIVAIAAGAADGLGFGDNGKAGPADPRPGRDDPAGDRGRRQPAHLRRAGGGGGPDRRRAAPTLSRNHRLGEELAKGRSWPEIEATLPGTAEGAYTVDAALALADRLGVEMPIAQEVHNAPVRGQERAALPGRPARPRVEGRARRLRPLGAAARSPGRGLRPGAGARLRVRRGVAQSGSAPVWGTGGRRFKSGRPDHIHLVRRIGAKSGQG